MRKVNYPEVGNDDEMCLLTKMHEKYINVGTIID